MLTYILYLIIAMIAAGTFKFISGLIMGGIGFILMFIFRIDFNDIDLLLIKHPKKFFIFSILNHSIIGAIYSALIAYITFSFINYYDGNIWLYIISSIFWGLTIISGTTSFYGVLVASCLGGLTALYLGFGYIGIIIVWLLVVLISIAYYLGRIDIINEQDYGNNF